MLTIFLRGVASFLGHHDVIHFKTEAVRFELLKVDRYSRYKLISLLTSDYIITCSLWLFKPEQTHTEGHHIPFTGPKKCLSDASLIRWYLAHNTHPLRRTPQ